MNRSAKTAAAARPSPAPLRSSFTLIEASAGTGKTYTITNEFLFLLLKQGLRVDQILVVTFTRAATAELKERIRNQILTIRDRLTSGSLESMEDKLLLRNLSEIVAGNEEHAVSRLTAALNGFDDAGIYTIHSFCQRVLGEYAFLIGGNMEFEVMEDELPLVESAVNDFTRREIPRITDPGEYGTFVSDSRLVNVNATEERNAPGRMAGQEQLRALLKIVGNPSITLEPDAASTPSVKLSYDLIDTVRRLLPEQKREQGLTSFSDMLLGVHQALGGAQGERLVTELRSQFRAALIDEFQDTDPLQYEIFRRIYLGSDSPVLFVGDPKQAIYSFRQGDVYAYFDAAVDIPPGGRRSLTENFRSSDDLVRAVNGIFAINENPHPFADDGRTEFPPAKAHNARGKSPRVFPREDKRNPLHWFLFSEPEKEYWSKPDAVKKAVKQTVDEVGSILRHAGDPAADPDRLQPGDIAILVRTHTQASAVQDELIRAGIPSVTRTQEDVFSSSEADDLLRLLRAIAFPGREKYRGPALLCDMLGYSAVDLASMADDHRLIDALVLELGRLRDIWSSQRGGFIVMGRDLLYASTLPAKGRKTVDWLGDLDHSERATTNILHLFELLHQESVVHPGAERLIGWFERRILDVDSRPEQALRLESDEKRVQILTIHSSKGLEYPVVFLPFAWEGNEVKNDGKKLTPYHRREKSGKTSVVVNLAPKLEKPADDVQFQRYAEEQRSEAIRLLYVGLTRARQRCYVTWGPVNHMAFAGLSHVLFPPGTITNSKETFTGLGYTGVIAPVRKLVGKFGKEMSCSTIEVERRADGGGDRPAGVVPPVLAPRVFRRGQVQRTWRSTSYTSLVKNAPPAAHDADLRAVESSQQGPDGESIFAFPAGERTGTAWHELFERLDFQSDQARIEAAVTDLLLEYGFDAKFRGPLVRLVQSALALSLTPAGPCLREITRDRRVSEMRFLFDMPGLDMDRLKRILSDPKYGLPAEFRTRTRELGPHTVSGFMVGAIDLLFEHEGRFYILDYKSNRLGVSAASYAEDRVRIAMANEHYYLQYLIYVAAVDRYLRGRVPGYSYDRHFGGVAYLFLRGVEQGERKGLFFDRPSAALVQALEAHFAGKEIAL